jgi:hypothetical protein
MAAFLLKIGRLKLDDSVSMSVYYGWRQVYMRVLKVHYYPDTDGCQKKLVIYYESSLALRTADAIAPNLDSWFPGIALPQRVMVLEQLFERSPKLIDAAIAASKKITLSKRQLAATKRLKQVADDAEKAHRIALQEWLKAERKFEETSQPINKFAALLDKVAEEGTR